MKVFFQGGGVGGFVDSWPKALVPSASNRSTPEWTFVDSAKDDSLGPPKRILLFPFYNGTSSTSGLHRLRVVRS
jgi:hypothetical protein